MIFRCQVSWRSVRRSPVTRPTPCTTCPLTIPVCRPVNRWRLLSQTATEKTAWTTTVTSSLSHVAWTINGVYFAFAACILLQLQYVVRHFWSDNISWLFYRAVLNSHSLCIVHIVAVFLLFLSWSRHNCCVTPDFLVLYTRIAIFL